ncbi:MAG: hypothetical protein EOP88_02820 [Verrucomicrobiaceae bacterium]|nr:MAG: hypothetical protein EOP88_02820 [Verrucomicrobiaceae bacterium]
MKTILLLLAATLVTARAQGPLVPTGPPAPGMKTLDQIEPRKLITTLPLTINEPGSYYLAGNIVYSALGVAIGVNASNVTIDLGGFNISSTGTANDSCIYIYSGNNNVRIHNGSITGNTVVTQTGAVSNRTWNVTTAGGFTVGINASESLNCQFSDLIITGCTNRGLILGAQSAVSSSIFRSNGNCATSVAGRGCTIIDCIAVLNGNQGGFAGNVAGDNEATFLHCVSLSNGDEGISAPYSSVTGCQVKDNGGTGIYAVYGCVTQCVTKDNDFPGVTANNGVISFCRGEGNDIGNGNGELSATSGTRVNNYPAP